MKRKLKWKIDFLLSVKILNIDINYIRKGLLYLNPDILTRDKIKDINNYDLRLFMEFYELTEIQSTYKFLINQLIILTLIKTTDFFSIFRKIKFMIENKYLNKNLSIKISDLRKYIIFNQLNIDKLSKLYFELEDYYFENECRRLELLKY